jgi:hypothetical protein
MNLIYIAGDGRSGSTLLDMMLSGHTDIVSVGECHQLKAYVTRDVRYYESVHEMICYCGSPLNECSFWQGVETQLGQPLDSLDLKPFFLRAESKKRPTIYIMKKIMWLLSNAIRPFYSNSVIHKLQNGERVGIDSHKLYDAVAKISGCKYVLDSSKDLHRLYSVSKAAPMDVKVILLCRDFKGTIFSKVKRGVPIFKAALQWKWTVRNMEYYSRKLNNHSILRVKYEDICNNTEHEMRRICDFLGLEFQEKILRRNTAELHHLGGSPSKHVNGDDSIRIDTSYLDHLTGAQRTLLYWMVRKEANIWGYGK